MTKRPPDDEDDYLAAEYALGLLDGAERDAFTRRLATSPILVQNLRTWEEHFVGFSNDIKDVNPPRKVQENLEKRLFGVAEQSHTSVGLWSSLKLWRGLAAGLLAGVVLVAGFNLRQFMEPQLNPQVLVAEVAGETGGLKMLALYDQEKGELRLNRVAGAPQSDRSFELWLIAGQDAPVSLGVMPAEANGQITVPVALRDKFAAGVLAISDEPKGGSPTGAPTGAVLATGKLTLI